MNESAKATILLTGKNGQVGWELKKWLEPIGSVVAVGRDELDLTNADAIRKVVRSVEPGLVVNGAAYTAVDSAETDIDEAYAVNETAPRILAEEAKKLDIPLIHFSTDYVFDGAKREPYAEDDEPNPQTVYGKSKLAGEIAIKQTDARHIILRLSWVYGARGNNFFRTMLRQAKERDELRIVDDQWGAPTWCREIAKAASKVARTLIADKQHISEMYHLPAGGTTTWCRFAREIFRISQLNTPPKVVPISSFEYSPNDMRPKYSVLSGKKAETAFGIVLPKWEHQLGEMIRSKGIFEPEKR
jgi:dTDP-4-dehydrorhamnose reductase